MNSAIFGYLLLLSACACTKLPPTFKKCNRNQNDLNECLSKAVKDAIEQLNRPFRDVGLPSMEPLEIPELTVGAGTGAVGLVQHFKNMKVHGFSKPETTKFEFDLGKKIALLQCTFAEVKTVAEYDVNGKILVLPVYGKGTSTIKMENVTGTETFIMEKYEKKGQKYLKVVEGKLVLTPGLVKFKLENLFDGDKTLGDNINSVMNENWKEVFADVKSSYEEAYSQIVETIFNNLLAKVPYDELFEK
ncbi:protein takeout-like [Zophobas morio]|uniref:protein takeout-like n=1 Tax=Zophobas morio TaxID=2755281 RepID=UPI003082A6FC